MSEVKRYGVISMGFIGEDVKGKYVKHADYAALRKKLYAVLAENARMLSDYREIPEMRRIGAPLTPSTDAILNEVRAEGLKMAIDHMNNQTSDDCADVTVLPVIEMYNQLRAGSTKGGV